MTHLVQGVPERIRSTLGIIPAIGEPGFTRMTALILDDDQAIRSLVRAVLTNRSYRVLEAADADEALAVCAQHQGPLRILVVDVMLKMPDGLETATRLMEAR